MHFWQVIFVSLYTVTYQQPYFYAYCMDLNTYFFILRLCTASELVSCVLRLYKSSSYCYNYNRALT